MTIRDLAVYLEKSYGLFLGSIRYEPLLREHKKREDSCGGHGTVGPQEFFPH